MENPLGNMTREEIMTALKLLMDKGLVEMSWSEEKNDFVFYITAKGQRAVDNDDWTWLQIVLGG